MNNFMNDTAKSIESEKTLTKNDFMEMVVDNIVQEEDYYNFMSDEYEKIKKLSDETKLSNRRFKRLAKITSSYLMDEILDTIIEQVSDGVTVHFVNFGTFEARKHTVPEKGIYPSSEKDLDSFTVNENRKKVNKKDIYIPKFKATKHFKQELRRKSEQDETIEYDE